MEISYLGHSSFFLKTKTTKIIMDPFDPKLVGLPFPTVSASIVTISHDHYDHNYLQGVKDYEIVFDWPGEFEKNGVRVFGFQTFHDKEKGATRGGNIMFKIETEQISILHCGDLCEIPNSSTIDEIGDIDILLVPIGGRCTLDTSEASSFIKKIDPSIVIPMHYNNPKMNQEKFGDIDGVDIFLKKYNLENLSNLGKISLKKEDLIDKEMEIVLL